MFDPHLSSQRLPAKRVAWISGQSTGIQKHVRALTLADVAGCLSPGVNPTHRRIVPWIVALALILFWPLMGVASSEFFSIIDLDQAEPVEMTSHIMSIDYVKGILVVAENQVMIVDVVTGGERFTTQVINSEGEPLSFEELSAGQTVLVQGLKLADGRIVAARVQQQ